MKENSIEEDMKILKESIIEKKYHIYNKYLKIIIEHILSAYKRVLKENEELKNDYENLNNSVVVKNHCIKNSIPVQEVKDLKDRILKNEEYTVVLEGDKEFPDSTTEATFEKYINLKVLDKLIERRK